MAWSLQGRYFESCSCDVPCPCTASFDMGADLDHCRALLAFHVDSGEIDGVDVSDVTVAIVADTPKVMTDGNWRVGVLISDNAADDQVEKLGAVFSGQRGGPMAALGPLIGEMVGMERIALEFSSNGTHVLRGEGVDLEVEDVVPFGREDGKAVELHNVFHPAGETLTVARSKRAKVDVFGIAYEGRSGFSAPFAWAG